MMLVEVALLVVLCSLQVFFGDLEKLLDVLSEVSCIKHLHLVSHNNINRQSNLFPYINSNGKCQMLSATVELIANST